MFSRLGSAITGQGQIIADLGKLIVENCPPMLCTGLDCAVVTERNGCQVCCHVNLLVPRCCLLFAFTDYLALCMPYWLSGSRLRPYAIHSLA